MMVDCGDRCRFHYLCVGYVTVLVCDLCHMLLVVYVICFFLFVFFFKQKTAYEMRISDWSSDVCSSDLKAPYLAAVYELDAAAESRGYEIRNAGMQTMLGCLSTNTWPGYPRGIQPLALPGWAIANEMEISYVE